MAAATGTRKGGFTLVHASVIGALIWIAALAAAWLLGGEWRTGLLIGVITGGVGGVAGVVLLGTTLDKPAQYALAARSVGFMVRVLLIAAGLLATMRVYHAEPLAFAFSFFALFFVFTGLEHLVSISSAAAGASAPAPANGEN